MLKPNDYYIHQNILIHILVPIQGNHQAWGNICINNEFLTASTHPIHSSEKRRKDLQKTEGDKKL